MRGERPGWRTMVVRVPLCDDYEGGIRTLRALEGWLAEHHRQTALFRADGRPRSDVVCLAVPEDEPEKAFAWRTFCGTLGVADGMVQWRTSGELPMPPVPPFTLDLDEAD
jgi:hypothetical protein